MVKYREIFQVYNNLHDTKDDSQGYWHPTWPTASFRQSIENWHALMQIDHAYFNTRSQNIQCQILISFNSFALFLLLNNPAVALSSELIRYCKPSSPFWIWNVGDFSLLLLNTWIFGAGIWFASSPKQPSDFSDQNVKTLLDRMYKEKVYACFQNF